MSDLYLRSVELSNFRVYGESYAYEFPDGPGVTLITGGNGLGKTCFFDGVEWALTGQVGRFSDIPTDQRRKEPDPLTRVGAAPDSHRVSLEFSDGTPIDRGAGFLPSQEVIADLLKQPNWPEIRNLHGYLSITHFLAQAATRRFSLREPKGQWEALKGPAGVDRINNLRERVSGQGARQAFTRAIKDRTQKLEEASETLRRWTSLLRERDRIARLSTSEQAIAPRQLLEAIEQLGQQLSALLPDSRWNPLSMTDEPESALNRLTALLQVADRLERDETERAETLDRLVREFEAARSETATLTTVVEEISARRSRVVDNLAEADESLADATTALAGSELIAAQLQARATALARVTAAASQMDNARRDLASIEDQLSRSNIEASKAQARIEDARAQLDAATARRNDRGRLLGRLTLAQRRAQISSSLLVVRSEIARLSPLAGARSASELREMRATLAQDSQNVATDIARLSSELKRHDERVRSLSEAVSMIAHRLRHDDTSCPVCATEFPPGRLMELALTRDAADTAPAAELGDELAAARVRSEDIARQLAETDRHILEHDQLLRSLAADQAREAGMLQELVQAGGAAEAHYDESESFTLRRDLDALDQQLAASPTPEALQALLFQAETGLDAERAKRVSLERGKSASSESIEAARALLLQHPDLWSPAGGFLIAVSEEQTAIEQRARSVGEEVRGAQSRLNEARIARDTLTQSLAREGETLASTNRQLDALVVRRQQLTRQWVNAGQTGEPDGVRLAQYRSHTSERRTRVEPLHGTHTQLISGYRKWLDDQQVQERERSVALMLEEQGVSTEAEVTERLNDRVEEAQWQLEIAQRARAKMEDTGLRMQESAEQFADHVLKPLNATIQRFARTLMTWSDASIIYRAEYHATRSELRPAILRTELDGTTTQLEMNPNLYFSEGQLSALSVSALLAASTTFSWSRWRGLLLDDPLQHNDVIHASAFMDLLRKMVQELHYQIILSTHDSAEAAFLGRKCHSAGVPYRVHELVPRGEEGLISAVA